MMLIPMQEMLTTWSGRLALKYTVSHSSRNSTQWYPLRSLPYSTRSNLMYIVVVLDDTDTIMNSFYYYCHLAGPFKCALYSPTPKAIEARLNTVLEQLKKHPIMVAPIGPSDLPELVSYSSLKRLISATLYRAVVMFPELARVVAALEKGDGAPFLELVTSQGLRQPFSCDCQSCSGNDDPPEEYDDPLAEDAFRAIMCSDGDELTETAEEFAEYAAALQNRSKSAGAVNVLFRIGCAGWKTRPKWRFQGKCYRSNHDVRGLT